ncbi:MAG TPA: mechanosensitive ion channel [Ferruginibacter sp.]|nr:mechanosensitive ion channel [Ferruginibacter sp.]HRO17765.1 mechanosensitive ion channel [Ferruginibacter sp.]
MNELKDWLKDLLIKNGMNVEWITFTSNAILLAATLLLAWMVFYLLRAFIIKVVHRFITHSQTKWDDSLLKHKVFNHLAHLAPVIIFMLALPVIFSDSPRTLALLSKVLDLYLIIVVLNLVIAFLKSLEDHLTQSKVFIDKPIASYFQLARIIIYIAAGIMLLSNLLGKSPLYFLGAFGAMTAILLLIFKDTILGLVASVQISANDMIRVGDWVEMPKYHADGDVVAINLNTVKVRNWDKTISTIPTHYFITDSFKNWRGMQESGGRRIKRSIYINISSIQFVSPEWRDELKKIHLVKNYLSERQAEIEKFNAENNIDTSILINGRRLTNIGIFRVYADAYLKNHPSIHKGMTLMVRQLASTEFGLPIEIYCFTNTIKWTEYESIQSDIFDHLLSAAEYFKLQIFQSPSGYDFNGSFSGNNPVA